MLIRRTLLPPLRILRSLVRRIFWFMKRSDYKRRVRWEMGTKWPDPYAVLRKKWGEVPSGDGRTHTKNLLDLDAQELLKVWTSARNGDLDPTVNGHRLWFHERYEPFLANKKVLDIGSGFGLSTITFAEKVKGIHVTFVDIVKDNLEVLRKVCKAKNLDNVAFVHLENDDSYKKLTIQFDVCLALGSMHHAPFLNTKENLAAIIPNLKMGGTWLQLAYPKVRWEREGKLPFSLWGRGTDGENTPWVEWYDADKLLEAFSPAKFRVNNYTEWHNRDFNWFDLTLLQR